VVAGRFNSDDCSRAGDHKDALSFLGIGAALDNHFGSDA
jgi:hypothetical protein